MSYFDFIPLCTPSLKGNEKNYVNECVDTEWVSSAGKFVNRFEDDLKTITGAKHVVAVVNGTAALHTALLLVGVCPGDEVIVPTVTFVAPINAVRYVYADPVFMDCDEYYNIDAVKTIEFIKNNTFQKDGFCFNASTNRRIAAIIPVHVFGNAIQADELYALCRERHIRIVEDSTEALGTVYKVGTFAGKHAGVNGDIGCLSFNGNKIVTTGGGGAILINDDRLAARARHLTTQAKEDEIRNIHNEVGFNYRLTNIQAALGVAQLERLSEILEAKNKNFVFYKEAFTGITGLRIADTPDYAKNNYWMYGLQIDADEFGASAEEVMKVLSEKKIQTRPLWYLNHLQKPFKMFERYKIEKAITLLGNTLNIPCSANLTEAQRSRVIQEIVSIRQTK